MAPVNVAVFNGNDGSYRDRHLVPTLQAMQSPVGSLQGLAYGDDSEVEDDEEVGERRRHCHILRVTRGRNEFANPFINVSICPRGPLQSAR